jgi:Helix-turn-helix domain
MRVADLVRELSPVPSCGTLVRMRARGTLHTNSMEHIGTQLAAIEQNMRINSADPIARHGFTQIPNFILRNPEISSGAKTVYALLLSYAWGNNLCFPGQERLAEHAGLSKRTVVTLMAELESVGLIEVERRGLGKTNLYTINFVIRPKKSRK